MEQLAAGAQRDLDVDPDRENRCGQHDQDVASEVEPVQTDGDDDRLPVDEVALELAVHPRSARHVTR